MNKQELITQITKYSQEYYDGNPGISDLAFDKLVQQLRDIDPNNELLTSTGWGYSVDKSVHRTKHEHTIKVSGINDKINIPDNGETYLHKYKDKLSAHNEYSGIIQNKLDGISAVCYYEDGVLKRVLTRGDGATGIDITKNAQHLVPNKLKYCSHSLYNLNLNGIVAVRGEIVMKVSEFDSETMGNMCSAASGIAMSIEGEGINKLDFVAYDVYNDQKGGYIERLEALGETGFNIINTVSIMSMGLNSSFQLVENVMKKFNTSLEDFNCKYPCDGSVVRIEQQDNNEQTVFVFKYPEKQYTSKVVAIHNQVSDLGNIIPVLEIEPTVTSRCTVRRMSLFNYQYVLDNKVSVGATVKFQLANGIIPSFDSVTEVNESEFSKLKENLVGESPQFPELEDNDSHVYWDGVNLCTTVDNTKTVIYNLLEHFSPDTISYSKINKLIVDLNIENIVDIKTNLKTCDINSLCSEVYRERYEQWVNNILNTPLTLRDVVNISNSKNVGDSVAKIVDTKLTASEFHEALVLFDNDIGIQSFLPKLPTYRCYKGLEDNKSRLMELLHNFKVINSPKDDKEKIKVSFTGKLSKSRSQLIKDWDVEEVSISNAQYLITNTPESSTGKNKEAKRLGIKSISEQEFTKLL